MFSHTQLYSAIRSHTQQDSVIPCSRTQPYSSILSRMVAPKLRRFVFDVFSRSLAFSIFLLNLLVNCVRIRFWYAAILTIPEAILSHILNHMLSHILSHNYSHTQPNSAMSSHRDVIRREVCRVGFDQRNPKPETRNPKPTLKTWLPQNRSKPETRNPKPETDC